MKDTVVPMDQAGRIVLPKSVRDELAIKPGDRFKLSICGDAVTLTPDKQKTGLVRKGKALVFSTGGAESLTNEMVNAISEEERQAVIGRIRKEPRQT